MNTASTLYSHDRYVHASRASFQGDEGGGCSTGVCRELTQWPPEIGSPSCFSNGWYFPKPRLQKALLPALRRMNSMRAMTAVHFRLGFVDWVQSIPEHLLHPGKLTLPTADVHDVWHRVEDVLKQCTRGLDGKETIPCVHWGSYDRSYDGPGREEAVSNTAPTLQYVLQSRRCVG
jgi:hypothetical protein